jgi:hypothetical protein
MSDRSDEANHFIITPTRQRINFFPLVGLDWPWTYIIAFIVLIFVAFNGEYANLVIAAGATVWVLTMLPAPKKDERIYYLFLVAPFKELFLALKKGVDWEATARQKKVLNAQGKYPYEVRVFGSMGLVYHLFDRTYSMVFRVSGSNISVENLITQHGMNARFGDLVIKASAITKLKGLLVTFGYDHRPVNPYEVENVFAERGALDAVRPLALAENKDIEDYTPYDRRMAFHHQLYNEMIQMPALGSAPQMVYVVTVDDNRKFRNILKRSQFYQSELRNQPLIRIKNTIMSQLSMLAEGVEMLDGFAAEEYLRRAWDIELEGYFDEIEIRLAESIDNTSGETEYDNENNHAPRESIVAHSDRLQLDGTHISTIKLTEGPLDQSPVNFIRDYTSVFDLPARYYSVSVTAQTRKGSAQYTRREAAGTVASVATSMLDAGPSGVKRERMEEERDEGMRLLDASPYTADYSIRIAILNTHPYTVESDDPDNPIIGLEDEVTNCIDALTKDRLGPEAVTMRFRQKMEALSTITHIPNK